METRNKTDWIDFSEVPERRKQPKRIQTLPASARDTVVFSYVPPERCRCECHAHAQSHTHEHGAADDELPLLQDTPGATALDEDHGAPFTADLDLRHNHADTTRPQ